MPIPQIAGGLALVDQLVRLFTPINRIIDELQSRGAPCDKVEVDDWFDDAFAGRSP